MIFWHLLPDVAPVLVLMKEKKMLYGANPYTRVDLMLIPTSGQCGSTWNVLVQEIFPLVILPLLPKWSQKPLGKDQVPTGLESWESCKQETFFQEQDKGTVRIVLRGIRRSRWFNCLELFFWVLVFFHWRCPLDFKEDCTTLPRSAVNYYIFKKFMRLRQMLCCHLP